MQEIVDKVSKGMEISGCLMNFKVPPQVIYKNNGGDRGERSTANLILHYSWIGISIILVVIVCVLAYKYFIKKRIQNVSKKFILKIPPSSPEGPPSSTEVPDDLFAMSSLGDEQMLLQDP